MSDSYDVTVKIRVTSGSREDRPRSADEDQEWANEGARLMAVYVNQLVGSEYRRLGAKFEVVSSEAKYLESVE